MNLHGIASRYVTAVNPITMGDIYVSSGNTTQADGTQVPQYTTVLGMAMQVQSLTTKDVRQVDSLNLAGSSNTAYIYGRVDGLVRSENKGGDLIVFRSGPPWLLNKTWLVTGVLEQWPDWCKVAITLQRSPP